MPFRAYGDANVAGLHCVVFRGVGSPEHICPHQVVRAPGPFPVLSTGLYRVVGVVDADAVKQSVFLGWLAHLLDVLFNQRHVFDIHKVQRRGDTWDV